MKIKKAMKTNKLMIGDWVNNLIDNKYYKIFSLLTNDVILENNESIFGYSCHDIEPIPLTAEILEKNGFVEFMPHNWQIVIDNIMIELRAPEHNMAIWLDWNEHDTGTYASYMLPRPDYVHELQHALKFCEIDKKIEI